MPRVSAKKKLKKWYLKEVEARDQRRTKEIVSKELTSSMKYLSRTIERAQRKAERGSEETSEEGDSDSSSSTSSSSSSSGDSSSEDEEHDLSEIEGALVERLSRRYLVPRSNLLKSYDFWFSVVPELPDDRYRQLFRVNRPAFQLILSRIGSSSVFNTKQAPIDLQLGATLRRFGGHGDVMQVAQLFGIGDGTVSEYTDRVCTALLELFTTEVRWSTEEEQTKMKARLRGSPKSKAWEDCIGFIDGTLVPFNSKPGFPMDIASGFFNRRKHRYGMAVTVVCDDQNRILHFTCLFPGSAHDSRAFKATDLYQHPDNYFSNRHQYLVGDQAYALSSRMITPFKKPRNRNITQEQKRFNTCLSHIRVAVENTIGILKSRFRCLKSLPVRLIGEDESTIKAGLSKVNHWMGACAVLHNLLLNFRDFWEPTQEELQQIYAEAAADNWSEETDDRNVGTNTTNELNLPVTRDEQLGRIKRDSLLLTVLEEYDDVLEMRESARQAGIIF
ncbi:hypothetical protein AA313_de0205720 [Arthrobotrys entomopaga]|nr:hypothetical protein AA313_de0205720 [Arthrobotrys entomopaga]